MLEDSTDADVVVSSRARIARNLPSFPFSPRANEDALRMIVEKVDRSFADCTSIKNFHRIALEDLSASQRTLLRESYLISKEFEKGGEYKVGYFDPHHRCSIMINEEDHLRVATLISGLRLPEVYSRLLTIQEQVEQHLDMAYSEDLGFLTACPTNVGTGLRLSVMLHLPALAHMGKTDEVFNNTV